RCRAQARTRQQQWHAAQRANAMRPRGTRSGGARDGDAGSRERSRVGHARIISQHARALSSRTARQTGAMDTTLSPAATLEREILEHIPLARAMQLRVPRYSGDELEMTAPLAPNINDKGCAFGGSMASLLTLAGWGLIELGLRTAGLDCDIYVGDSQLRYREPVW